VLALVATPSLVVATAAGGDQISDLQAQASQIEQQINVDTEQIGILGQRYDQALDEINQLNGEIAKTRAEIETDEHHVTVDKSKLRLVAINSYMSTGSAVQSNPLFAGDQTTYGARVEYGQVATGNLGVVVADLHTAQVQLNAAEATLTSQQQQAQNVANDAAQERAAAQNQQAELNTTLGQVNGQIAVLIAEEQAAAVAAAQARARDALASALRAATPASAAGAVAAAESQLDVPYVWGGSTPRGTPGDPSGGFDCSGLVMWAWAQAGVSLPHFSGSQFGDTAPVSLSSMEPGDILFYGDGGDEHEAMYVGGGQMIEAPQTGEVVHITPIRLNGGFAGVHRP
jgi:cell wall-associated NlpC family hydrolase